MGQAPRVIDHEEVVAWLEASCKAQGVPVKVTDPIVLARVAVLFNAGREHHD